MEKLYLRFIDGCQWRLTEPYYYSGEKWCGKVPRGFITDFASVPRILWNILPPTGQYGPAAVIHDYLYRTAAVPRCDADWTFLEAMTRLGVPYLVRHAMYRAVRLFGGAAYHRPAPKPGASSLP
jgi:hypothetical protein